MFPRWLPDVPSRVTPPWARERPTPTTEGTLMKHATIGRIVFATQLLALGMALPAAAIDLSGDYVVSASASVPVAFRFLFSQTGTTLQLTGSCDYVGTVSANG